MPSLTPLLPPAHQLGGSVLLPRLSQADTTPTIHWGPFVDFPTLLGFVGLVLAVVPIFLGLVQCMLAHVHSHTPTARIRVLQELLEEIGAMFSDARNTAIGDESKNRWAELRANAHALLISLHALRSASLPRRIRSCKASRTSASFADLVHKLEALRTQAATEVHNARLAASGRRSQDQQNAQSGPTSVVHRAASLESQHSYGDRTPDVLPKDVFPPETPREEYSPQEGAYNSSLSRAPSPTPSDTSTAV